MKKHIANIISSIRIIGAVVLFFFNDFTVDYLLVYAFCGLTDLIDGPIARKTGTTSILGAFLDTAGDGFVSMSMLKIFLFKKMVPFPMLVWLVIALGVFFAAAGISYRKFKKFYIPHTYLDKLLGGVTYTMPFIVCFEVVEPIIWMWILGIVLSVAAVETFIIQLKAKTAKDFVPCVFCMKD